MKSILLINRIAASFGLTLFLIIQSFANVGRLRLLTGEATWPLLFISGLLLLFLATGRINRLIRRLRPSLWNSLLYVLWFPYVALFTYSWTRVIPAPDEAAWPSPAVGLFIIGITLMFPFYIGFVHLLARTRGVANPT
jgi:hypothetical protein